MVAEPWLEGLYPALQNLLSVDSTVSITESVKSLTISSGGGDHHSAASHSSEFSDSGVSTGPSQMVDSPLVKETNALTSDCNTGTHEETNQTNVSGMNGLNEYNAVEDASFLEQKTYFNNQRHIETSCKPVDLTSQNPVCPLTSLSDDLCEKSLTVPVLPPDFLKVCFSPQIVKVRNLSQFSNKPV